MCYASGTQSHQFLCFLDGTVTITQTMNRLVYEKTLQELYES